MIPGGGLTPLDINEIIGGQTPMTSHTPTDNNSQNKVESHKDPILYSNEDLGPFIVFVESTTKTNNNVGRFNNLKIAKEIFDLQLKEVKKINNKGLNRLAIEFNNWFAANSFIKNSRLIEKGYKLYIPFNFVTCKGLVRHVDIDEDINNFANICKCDVEILSAKRLNRKVISNNKTEYVPTGTILFTFRGVFLPKIIHFYGLPLPVAIYIPPVTQCFACLLYGHTKKNCKGKEKCYNCGEKKHENDQTTTDSTTEFSCLTKCHFCKESHKTTSKTCPEYQRQLEIKKLMAYENLTFYDADSKCARTYAPNREYVFNPREYPSLPNRDSTQRNPNKDTIPPNLRRTTDFNMNKGKRTFQQATTEEPNKKRLIQKGFDKTQHNEALYFPNSRPSTRIGHTNNTNPGYSWSQPTTSNRLRQPISAQQNLTSLSHPTSAFQDSESEYVKIVTDNFQKISQENQQLIKKFILTHLNLDTYMDLDDPTSNGWK